VASNKPAKASLSGKRGNSVSTQREGLVTRVVDFFRIPKPKYIIKVPLGQKVGNVTYTVESLIDPVTFTKRKDAVAFQKLLINSVHSYKSDIVRREITDGGFHLH
jgi:hypothetical protein